MGRPEEIGSTSRRGCGCAPTAAAFTVGHALVVDGGQTAVESEDARRARRDGRRVVLAIILAGYLLVLIDVSILMAALPQHPRRPRVLARPACRGRRTPTR